MWNQPRDLSHPTQAEMEEAMNKENQLRQAPWPSLDAGYAAAKGNLETWPHWAGTEHHNHDDEDEDDEDDESKHHCTDFFCLVVFLLALATLGVLLLYSGIQGDTRRLYHGYNFTGHLCGVDAPDKPYVFWCRTSSNPLATAEAIDTRHPMCVEACPTSSLTNHTCFAGVQQDKTESTAGGVTVQKEETQFVWSQVKDYSSTVYLGRYCLPEDLELKAPLLRVLSKHSMTKIFTEMSQLTNATLPLTLAVCLAIILGYVYLLILDKFAWCMVYTAIVLVVVSSLLVGLYLLISNITGGLDGIPHTGDSTWNTIVGLVLLGICIGFCVFACCVHGSGSIEVAIGCVQASCECMFDMLDLLLEPLLMLAVKVMTILALLGGAVQLATVGIDTPKSVEEFSELYEIPGHKVNGVFRTFSYHQDQIWYVSFYAFMSVWIFCFLTALSQFILAYAAQLWYFTPYVMKEKDYPSCAVLKGCYIGTRYHSGSLALGSFLIAPTHILKAVLSLFVHASELEGNCLLELIAKCLVCLLVCYQHCIEFLSKNAYIDIAINSSSFCEGAKNSLHILSSEITAIAFLNGATWVFKLVGYAFIVGGSTMFFWLLVRNAYAFSDVESDHHIPDPVSACVLSGILCFIVAVVFMVVFDTVSDTMLYCFAVEEQQKQKGALKPHTQYAPETLHRLIEQHSHYKTDPKQGSIHRTRLASTSDEEDGHEWWSSPWRTRSSGSPASGSSHWNLDWGGSS